MFLLSLLLSPQLHPPTHPCSSPLGPPFLYPTEDDFQDPEEYMPETMPPNQVSGPYDSPEEYIHTQFKLLRSDCFSEFVESMYYKAFAQEAYNMLSDYRKGPVQRATRFYTGVELVGVNMSLFAWNPTQWTLFFKTSEKVALVHGDWHVCRGRVMSERCGPVARLS